MSDSAWETPEAVAKFADRDPDLRLLELIDDYGDPGAVRVLDLGCAGGRNSELLVRRGFDLLALDASRAMVAHTRERLAPIVGEREAELPRDKSWRLHNRAYNSLVYEWDLYLAWREDSDHLGAQSDEKRTPSLRGKLMHKEYDFSRAERGPVVSVPQGKTRIAIRLDEDIVAWFKNQVHQAGGGNYQSLINAALREHIRSAAEPLEDTLRRVLRQELTKVS